MTLLFGAMAILVPAGAIGFLAYTGASLASERLPGGLIGGAITAVVVVIVVGALLPQIFTPLDDLYLVMDGHRYVVFASGIGKLAGVLSNFNGSEPCRGYRGDWSLDLQGRPRRRHR